MISHSLYLCRGLHTFAFSPDNKMLASGGTESLTIWQLQGQMTGAIIKQFQKQGSPQQPGGN